MSEDELALIPRSVRDKLDRIGIKLHLAEWERLTLGERRRLVDEPCGSAAEVERYRAALDQLVLERTGRPAERLAPPQER